MRHNIAGDELLGEVRTAPRYRFFCVRDEFGGIFRAASGGRHTYRASIAPMGP